MTYGLDSISSPSTPDNGDLKCPAIEAIYLGNILKLGVKQVIKAVARVIFHDSVKKFNVTFSLSLLR